MANANGKRKKGIYGLKGGKSKEHLQSMSLGNFPNNSKGRGEGWLIVRMGKSVVRERHGRGV